MVPDVPVSLRVAEPLPGPQHASQVALVHVWAALLDDPLFQAMPLQSLLAPDEKLRAARFQLERDRQRYVVGRSLLRLLIAAYEGCAPASVQFMYGPSGKPALQPGRGRDPLHFNVAHAGAQALFAFSRAGEVGVDIENVRAVQQLDMIADHYFTTSEAGSLRELPEAARVSAFFRCWTRKESVLKALGDGLDRPLQQFSVPTGGEGPLSLEWHVNAPAVRSNWSLHHVDPGAAFVGAVAVRADRAHVDFQWLKPDAIRHQSAGPSI